MDASVHPVRAFRLRQNPPVTLEDLAGRIGTTKANLSRIETGKQTLSDQLLAKVVTETGISARLLRPDLAKLFGVDRARRRQERAA